MDEKGRFKVEIDMTGEVAGYDKRDTIKIDGINYASGIRGFSVPHTRAGDLVRVELDVLCVGLGFHFADCAYVGIPQETADLLITLGWTPPDGSNALVNRLADAFQSHTTDRVLAHSHDFPTCGATECAALPTVEREALRFDVMGMVVSRHPVGPFGPDATPLDGPPMKAVSDDNA